MKKAIVCGIGACLLAIIIYFLCFAEKPVTELTYAVFPYVADVPKYEDLIEEKWAEIEPDIRHVRADYNCYHDTDPKDIDVIMYDAFYLNTLVENKWIQPIEAEDIDDVDGIYSFALDGVTVDGKIYGIPVFLCGNFLIYDRSCEVLASAEHITDLAEDADLLLIGTEDSGNEYQYYLEAVADILQTDDPANADCPEAEDVMELLGQLAIDEYESVDPDDLPGLYNDGIGMGYIGYSETMPYLTNRFSQTDIKQISFSDGENIQRFYVDAAAINAGVSGKKYDKCVELANVIADAKVLSTYSVYGGEAKYLMLARKDCYEELKADFPLYSRLEELAADENNTVIVE